MKKLGQILAGVAAILLISAPMMNGVAFADGGAKEKAKSAIAKKMSDKANAEKLAKSLSENKGNDAKREELIKDYEKKNNAKVDLKEGQITTKTGQIIPICQSCFDKQAVKNVDKGGSTSADKAKEAGTADGR